MSVEQPDSSASTSSSDSKGRPELLRVLGLGIAIAMVVGNTIGSGIFLKPGKIAGDAGSFPLIVWSWIGGGLVCLLGALCFAELGAMLPRAGGMFVYLKEAYGRPVAFVFGWCEFFFGTPASCGALSVAIVGTLTVLVCGAPPPITCVLTSEITAEQTTIVVDSAADFPPSGLTRIEVGSEKMTVTDVSVETKTLTVRRGAAETKAVSHKEQTTVKGKRNPNSFGIVGGALLLLAFVTFINVRGAIWGGSVQAVTTVIKAGSVAFIALVPFLLLAVGKSQVDFANFATEVTPLELNLTSQLAAVMLAVMWAYNGWEGVTPVAAEVRDPSRNIPRALIGGVGILIVVYVGANLAYHGVLSMSELKEAGMQTAPVMLNKQFGVFGPRAGEIAATAVSLVISLSAFGAINSNLMHSPRVAYAMGQDGVFFQILGRVHASYRTPAIAICTQATMAALMVVGFEFAQRHIEQLMDFSLFDLLTDYVIFSASVFQVLTVIGVFLLRRKHPEWERPYRVLGYPVTPLLFIGFYLWFLPTAYRLQSFSAHVALVLIAAGIPAYFIYAKWKPRTASGLSD